MKFLKPYSIEEALEALEVSENRGTNENAVILAGGTDLMIKLHEEKLSFGKIVDISDVKELKQIEISHNLLTIGACVTFDEISSSELIKSYAAPLSKAASMVGSPQIRNMGTIGGNVANASPAADTSPVLIAMNAHVVAVGRKNSVTEERVIPIREFFKGKGKTDLKEGELIKEFRIFTKKVEDGNNISHGSIKEAGAFEKIGLRNALAISRISVAVHLEISGDKIINAGVGSGSIGQMPTYELEISNFLIGKSIASEDLEETIADGSDFFENIVAKRLEGRGTAFYKSSSAQGIFERALRDSISQLG